ncbi:hypothetical protein EON67_10430, partial [archaeon]
MASEQVVPTSTRHGTVPKWLQALHLLPMDDVYTELCSLPRLPARYAILRALNAVEVGTSSRRVAQNECTPHLRAAWGVQSKTCTVAGVHAHSREPACAAACASSPPPARVTNARRAPPRAVCLRAAARASWVRGCARCEVGVGVDARAWGDCLRTLVVCLLREASHAPLSTPKIQRARARTLGCAPRTRRAPPAHASTPCVFLPFAWWWWWCRH